MPLVAGKKTGRTSITQHIGLNPRVMETTGPVLLGLEPDTPLL